MVIFKAVLNGLLLGIILIISVGPVLLGILQKSLSFGVKRTVFFCIGITFSDILFVIIIQQFSAFFSRTMEYKNIIALLGGVFFIVYGFILFFKTQRHNFTVETQYNSTNISKKEMFKFFTTGLMFNSLNPGVYIFWVAWGATIHLQSIEYEPQQNLYKWTVFLTCLFINFNCDLLKTHFANKLKIHLKDKNINVLNKITACIFTITGIYLIVAYTHLLQ